MADEPERVWIDRQHGDGRLSAVWWPLDRVAESVRHRGALYIRADAAHIQAAEALNDEAQKRGMALLAAVELIERITRLELQRKHGFSYVAGLDDLKADAAAFVGRVRKEIADA